MEHIDKGTNRCHLFRGHLIHSIRTRQYYIILDTITITKCFDKLVILHCITITKSGHYCQTKTTPVWKS